MKIKIRRKILAMMKFSVYGILLQSICFSFLIAGDGFAMQQGTTISGQVISGDDQTGLPGVNVIEKGTSRGTVTDVEGNYTLEIPGENAVLVYSSVGFTTQEITVGNQTVIDIVLLADLTSLEEIVVIGYGTMRKSDVTGSVASVTPEELVDRPVVNIGQALQNKVSGVQVVKQGTGEKDLKDWTNRIGHSPHR